MLGLELGGNPYALTGIISVVGSAAAVAIPNPPGLFESGNINGRILHLWSAQQMFIGGSLLGTTTTGSGATSGFPLKLLFTASYGETFFCRDTFYVYNAGSTGNIWYAWECVVKD